MDCPQYIFWDGDKFSCAESYNCTNYNYIVGDFYQCANTVYCPNITYMLSLKTYECVNLYPTNSIINYYNNKLCYKTCPLLVVYEKCVEFCTATVTTNCAVNKLTSCSAYYYKNSCASTCPSGMKNANYLCYH